VRKLVSDVDPRIAAAVRKTKECLDWKICYRDPIPTWVSKSHKIALLGDSCHAHLPTSAQGASQATESGAVLALCLKLAGKGNVPLAVSEAARRLMVSNILQTRVYEKLRFERVRKSQLNGEDLRDRWHNALKNLDDDVEIDPEDIKMRVRVPNPSLLPSADVFLNGQNRWLYPFDAEADTLQRWQVVSAQVSKELEAGHISPLFEVAPAIQTPQVH